MTSEGKQFPCGRRRRERRVEEEGAGKIRILAILVVELVTVWIGEVRQAKTVTAELVETILEDFCRCFIYGERKKAFALVILCLEHSSPR